MHRGGSGNPLLDGVVSGGNQRAVERYRSGRNLARHWPGQCFPAVPSNGFFCPSSLRVCVPCFPAPRTTSQTQASVDKLLAAAQDCQSDVRTFARAGREVEAMAAKKLPKALSSIAIKLQELEETIAEMEEAARDHEVRASVVMSSWEACSSKRCLILVR